MTDYSAPNQLTPTEARTAATLAHLSGPIAAFFSVGWLSIIGPLAVWLIYKDRSSAVRKDAAEAFNFQLTMWLMSIIGGLICFTVILIPLGVLMIAAGWLGSIIMGIIGAVQVTNGRPYTYPWRINVLN